jgi:hypothetical protein
VFLSGERADFVLTADQAVSAYWLHVSAAEDCSSLPINGSAILRYEGAPADSRPISPVESGLKLGSSSSTVSCLLLHYLCLRANRKLEQLHAVFQGKTPKRTFNSDLPITVAAYCISAVPRLNCGFISIFLLCCGGLGLLPVHWLQQNTTDSEA